ncbi:hypothetical protein AGLY_007135 [Aphis glycines]|uniref:Uncharacterized protein n=1 Tax=Aphis glycines TaxID=307491 RepID=A0A6G0TNQ5_APHGL|nr:hypothetical protein AGLY_007135 [Aphis glycines]
MKAVQPKFIKFNFELSTLRKILLHPFLSKVRIPTVNRDNETILSKLIHVAIVLIPSSQIIENIKYSSLNVSFRKQNKTATYLLFTKSIDAKKYIYISLIGMQDDKPSPEPPVENNTTVLKNSISIKHFVPKVGLLHHRESLQLILCKPKLMPLKSMTLEKLQKMQSEAEKKLSNR